MKELQKLSDIQVLDGFRVRAAFKDGFAGEVDLAPLLDCGPIFQPMREKAVFRGVVLERGVPVWPGDVDLSPDSLRAWCEAGRFLDFDETDEWIEEHSEQAHRVT